MANFRYKAFNPAGIVVEGDVDACSVEAAFESVRARGIVPCEARDAAALEPWWRRELKPARGPGRKAVASFTGDLAILLRARIVLGDALRIVAEQTSDKRIRTLAHRLREEVLGGRSMSDALLTEGAPFGDDYVSVVRAGEMGGSLAEVFAELAALHERRLEVDGKIRAALIYPAVLAVMAMVSAVVIASVLVPNIAPIFIENGKPLPPFIAFVMAARDNVLNEGLALAAAVGGSLGLRTAIYRSPAARARWHAVQLKVPIAGSLLLNRETARFARTLGTLMKSGVPIIPGFLSAVSGVTNLHVGSALRLSLDNIREGAFLAEALKRQGVLPHLAVHMIAVGEETGQLPHLLLRVASLFEDQGRRRVDRLMSLLTPALTIVISAFVGALIMSVMSAVLGINDLATQ